jgi:hypothetical protein
MGIFKKEALVMLLIVIIAMAIMMLLPYVIAYMKVLFIR